MTDIHTKTSLNSDGVMLVERKQDVSEILKQNKTEANDGWQDRIDTRRDTWGRKVATIPIILLEQWAKEWGVPYHHLLTDPDLKAKVMLRLNDPEFVHLRTHNSRI